jgi:glucose dehydrogenase
LLLSLTFAELPVFGQKGASNGEWRQTSGDGGSTRYSPLDQINRDNVDEVAPFAVLCIW